MAGAVVVKLHCGGRTIHGRDTRAGVAGWMTGVSVGRRLRRRTMPLCPAATEREKRRVLHCRGFSASVKIISAVVGKFLALLTSCGAGHVTLGCLKGERRMSLGYETNEAMILFTETVINDRIREQQRRPPEESPG